MNELLFYGRQLSVAINKLKIQVKHAFCVFIASVDLLIAKVRSEALIAFAKWIADDVGRKNMILSYAPCSSSQKNVLGISE